MIKDYFNQIHNDNIDVQEIIKAVQPEFDDELESLQFVYNDVFPQIATETGVERWERILGIIASPSIEPMQFRRDRIVNRIRTNIPFTERVLRDMINNILGPGAWSYELDHNNYELSVTSLRPGRNWLLEMIHSLESIIPANILYRLFIYYSIWQLIYDDFSSWQEVYERHATWQDVMEGITI